MSTKFKRSIMTDIVINEAAIECFAKMFTEYSGMQVHIDNFFRNLIKSTRNQIVFTIFQLTWIQTDVRLDTNQSENGQYNLISG